MKSPDMLSESHFLLFSTRLAYLNIPGLLEHTAYILTVLFACYTSNLLNVYLNFTFMFPYMSPYTHFSSSAPVFLFYIVLNTFLKNYIMYYVCYLCAPPQQLNVSFISFMRAGIFCLLLSPKRLEPCLVHSYQKMFAGSCPSLPLYSLISFSVIDTTTDYSEITEILMSFSDTQLSLLRILYIHQIS